MEEQSYRIALIPGDGIGQEVVPAAAHVLDNLPLSIEFVELDAGWGTFERMGTALPEATLHALKNCDGALFGATSSPNQRVEGYSSPIIAMRRQLDLYANLRPIRSTPLASSRPDIDMLIVRENSEGLYVKEETLSEDGQSAVAQRVITRSASERIAHVACREALRQMAEKGNGSSTRLTVVHKANVLSISDGLFRESVLGVASGYPGVAVEEQLVDSMAYRLILEPQRYDVVVAPNLYGDILSDAAAALVGGLGLVPSANAGDSFVVAEPVHGSAPDIAGQGIANPIATIRAAALLLASLNERMAASAIETAVSRLLADGPHTRDLGGAATTDEVTSAIIDRMGE